MKFTLNWLKDYLDTSATAQEIAEKLTSLGLEVEGIHDPAADLSAFTVAEVIEALPHPNADKLRVCKVNTGTQTLQIVCGAPNARAGIKVALAQEGALIPNGNFKIKKSKIRDVESNGMLCSAKELNLGDDHAGIIELPATAVLGEPIANPLGLNDPVIEIAITPNRGDCLGVYGIARDLSAAGLGVLKPLDTSFLQKQESLPSKTHAFTGVTLSDNGCKHFAFATLSGVKNADSPEWLKQRLKAVGQKPISALVDVTNYFSIAYARPLHVYDLDRLQGDITVREGKAGETFEALNDKPVTLQGGEIAIADNSGVIGLGGIIGGTSTACESNTTNVLLECAWFEPIRIAKAGRAHSIDTDARYRFERHVDPESVESGAAIAVQMILELCGGEASAVQSVGSAIHWQRDITFDATTINQRIGMDVPAAKQQQILESLGFTISGTKATPPSWRPDVEGTADLSEEVARIIGYDAIPVLPLEKPAHNINPRSEMQERALAARQTLAEAGLREGCFWSFTASEIAAQFGGAPAALKLLNPISADLDQMRPSLLPHLVDTISRNTARGLNDSKLFEVGLQFSGLGEKGQQMMASGVFAPVYTPKTHYFPARASDVFDAKSAIEAVITAAGFDASRLQLKAEAPAWYHPGKSGSFSLGKQVVAQFGEIHPRIAKTLDAPEGIIAFEIFLEAIPQAKKKSAARAPLVISDFQPVTRDFAFVVKQNVEAGEILRAAQKADANLVKKVELFDVYQGKGLADDEKSLAISVTLQAADRTLTDKEIEDVSSKVIMGATKTGARLRA